MFFHRAGGRLFYVVVTVGFFLLSIQNTWDFLSKVLPDASWLFLVMMMIVFEAGFAGWLAMLVGGAENVWRALIAFVMMLITGSGVFVGAYYEIGGMMHKGIGYHVDPAVLAYVPKSVVFAYIATGVAVVLYGLASPHFFYRMKHMGMTGQAPAIGSHILMLPPTYVGTENQLQGQRNQAALPAPKTGTIQQAPPTGKRNKLGNLFARWGALLQNGATTYTAAPIDDPAGASNEPENLRDETAPEADAETVSVTPEMQAEVQYSVTSRSAQPRAHQRSNSAPQRKRRSPAQIDRILSALDAQNPGLNDTELARQAGVSRTTVANWRR